MLKLNFKSNGRAVKKTTLPFLSFSVERATGWLPEFFGVSVPVDVVLECQILPQLHKCLPPSLPDCESH